MYMIGENNAIFVNQSVIEEYLNIEHREKSVYGVSKGDYFWMVDMIFTRDGDVVRYIKRHQARGFKVYHNMTFIIEAEQSTTDEEIELHTLLSEDGPLKEFAPTVKEVNPVEEVKRKGTGRGRGKE